MDTYTQQLIRGSQELVRMRTETTKIIQMILKCFPYGPAVPVNYFTGEGVEESKRISYESHTILVDNKGICWRLDTWENGKSGKVPKKLICFVEKERYEWTSTDFPGVITTSPVGDSVVSLVYSSLGELVCHMRTLYPELDEKLQHFLEAGRV